MTSGDVIRHSLLTFSGPLCLLRPLELGFGLSALLRMFGHGCTYWGVPAGSEKENRDSVGHLRSAQAGGQGENSFYLVLHSSYPSRGKYSWLGPQRKPGTAVASGRRDRRAARPAQEPRSDADVSP